MDVWNTILFNVFLKLLGVFGIDLHPVAGSHAKKQDDVITDVLQVFDIRSKVTWKVKIATCLFRLRTFKPPIGVMKPDICLCWLTLIFIYLCSQWPKGKKPEVLEFLSLIGLISAEIIILSHVLRPENFWEMLTIINKGIQVRSFWHGVGSQVSLVSRNPSKSKSRNNDMGSWWDLNPLGPFNGCRSFLVANRFCYLFAK